MSNYIRPNGHRAFVVAGPAVNRSLRWARRLALGTALLAGSSGGALATDVPAYVAAAVASISRPPQDMALDALRKPAETLAFSGIEPGEKVLELLPGNAYYTRILSKLVGPGGTIYAFAPGVMMMPPGGRMPVGAPGGPPPGAPSTGRNMGFPQTADPIDAVYRLSRATEFANLVPIWGVNASAYGGYIGLPEQVDLVWAAGIYHQFRTKSFGGMAPVAVDRAVFRDLKPGGTYLVEDNASGPSADDRIDPETIKREVLAAGFVLAAQEQLGGTTDSFVLRFKKPADAPAIDKHRMDQLMAIYFGNTFVSGSTKQRAGTIFYHEDHTYQEFNGDHMTNGIWFIDADGNNCMMHQTERAGGEGTTACRPAVVIKKLGEVVQQPVDGASIPVSLMKGYVYPNVTMPNNMPVMPPASAPPRSPP